jgi:hypothetical protein
LSAHPGLRSEQDIGYISQIEILTNGFTNGSELLEIHDVCALLSSGLIKENSDLAGFDQNGIAFFQLQGSESLTR